MLDASRRGHVRRHVLLDLVETGKDTGDGRNMTQEPGAQENCDTNVCIQRPQLPPEVLGEIARAAWVDVALWDHAALYVALVSTHPYLREIMPPLAWTYVFCRSCRDFALYLHLRFGDVLSDQKVYKRHAELHISSNFRREIKELVHQRPLHPRLSKSIISALRSVPRRKLFSAAPMTAMYSAFPDVPHPMDPHVGLDLSLAYADTITDL
jgi:hypothetical protein